MQKDRIKWNEKHRKMRFSAEPSLIVKKYCQTAPAGKALDIAAGNGKNAVFLANHGFDVEAVDISDRALTRLSGRHPDVSPICADLDVFDIPPSRYSLIINVRYLNRRLFPYIQEGLIPGGLLIFETYLDPPPGSDSGVFCRDYLLRSNELLHAFLPLNIIFYAEQISDEKDDNRRVASLVAMKSN
jgi:tellurite methyltransferase